MGLLDALKQYISDAMPGGLLNPEMPTVGNQVRKTIATLDRKNKQVAGLLDNPTPEAFQTAMDIVGMAPMGMTAWHGSPHKFDKFSLDKIGTGEGAQAYGHGLYLAESPEVAKQYADNVKDMGAVKNINNELSRLAKIMSDDSVSGGYRQYRSDAGRNAAKQYDEMMAARDGVRTAPGNMYKTDIPDEAVARFLDWDKPLSQQAPEVRSAINRIAGYDLPDRLTGMSAQTNAFLNRKPDGVPAAKAQEWFANEAHSAGIPGIRYLDGGSRGAGQGSSNFVAFDPEMIRILERNGQPTGLQPWQPGEYRGLLGP